MQQLTYIYERKIGGKKANVTNANNWGTGMKIQIYTHDYVYIFIVCI